MKQGMLASYFSGIIDKTHGQSYSRIIKYFLPEYITSFVIFALPFWIDSYFIGHLKSTPSYATLGITNNTFHLLFKIAEAFSIGTVILAGHFNGMHEFKKVGRVITDAFWTTLLCGALITSVVYFGAYHILYWLNAPQEIIDLGIPFVRIRALGIFFIFLYLAFIGFLRGIKNTRTTMYVFVIGAITFTCFDYLLIFGAFGLPQLGLYGSAWASVIQSIVMSIAAACFVFCDKRYAHYGINLFAVFKQKDYFKQLFVLIWPVMTDKATLAFAYIWLNKMINGMGLCSAAAFCSIKDLERFAFLPAIGLAQVITFLVSNDYGIGNWAGIKANIKKIIFLGSIMVFSILALFSFFPASLMKIFDQKGEFSDITIRIFPILSVLVFFDLVQLILSGALRGASDVKIVMWTRLAVCIGYFVPVSYMLSRMPITDPVFKFLLIYGSFYVGNALMSIVYIKRLRGSKWKAQEL